ncbi:MAG: transglutaminase domain-containing protein [Candidatus Hodarchaeales archaeon]|jgi:hypothetical protein
MKKQVIPLFLMAIFVIGILLIIPSYAEEEPNWIPDPTGKTEGYFLSDFSSNEFELVASRSATARHFYNKLTGEYRYESVPSPKNTQIERPDVVFDNSSFGEGIFEENDSLAGGGGGGASVAGTWNDSTDTFDLWRYDSSTYYQGNSYMKVGKEDFWNGNPRHPHDNHQYYSWLAFDTDIVTAIDDISNATFSLYVTSTTCENIEGASVTIYNIGNNWDDDSCKEGSTSWTTGTYSYYQGAMRVGNSTGWIDSFDTSAETLIQGWADNRNSFEDMISIYLSQYACDTNSDDYFVFDESTGTYDPKITFTYTLDTSNISNSYAGSYSGNSNWSNVTEAYTDNGMGANSSTSGAQIDYGINQTQFSTMNASQNLSSWLFYDCNVIFEWKVHDTGNTSSAYDDLYVKFYHNMTDSWTDWTILAHNDENWHADVVTESTNYWSPNDLQYLQVRLQHQNSSDGDVLEVDYLRLEVYNSSESWEYYLSSDWARHPDDSYIISQAEIMVDSDPTNKTGAIYENLTAAWDWGDFGTYTYAMDAWVFDNYTEYDEYRGLCYTSAAFYSSLARALEIPARIIRFEQKSTVTTYDHQAIEFYLNGEWIPASTCGEEGWTWYGWDNHTELEFNTWFPENDSNEECVNLFVVLEILGDGYEFETGLPNEIVSVSLQEFDPAQYNKYCQYLGYNPHEK